MPSAGRNYYYSRLAKPVYISVARSRGSATRQLAAEKGTVASSNYFRTGRKFIFYNPLRVRYSTRLSRFGFGILKGALKLEPEAPMMFLR
jgi:hypothetical protein